MENVNLEIIGVIAAVLTTSGFVPQVYKSFKTKNVTGISITMYIVLLIGMMFWLYYGILIESFSIKLANIVSGILVISLIVLRILYRNK